MSDVRIKLKELLSEAADLRQKYLAASSGEIGEMLASSPAATALLDAVRGEGRRDVDDAAGWQDECLMMVRDCIDALGVPMTNVPPMSYNDAITALTKKAHATGYQEGLEAAAKVCESTKVKVDQNLRNDPNGSWNAACECIINEIRSLSPANPPAPAEDSNSSETPDSSPGTSLGDVPGAFKPKFRCPECQAHLYVVRAGAIQCARHGCFWWGPEYACGLAPPKSPPEPVATAATVRNDDLCPKCGGELDTGWECNKCDYDAKPMTSAELKERCKLLPGTPSPINHYGRTGHPPQPPAPPTTGEREVWTTFKRFTIHNDYAYYVLCNSKDTIASCTCQSDADAVADALNRSGEREAVERLASAVELILDVEDMPNWRKLRSALADYRKKGGA